MDPVVGACLVAAIAAPLAIAMVANYLAHENGKAYQATQTLKPSEAHGAATFWVIACLFLGAFSILGANEVAGSNPGLAYGIIGAISGLAFIGSGIALLHAMVDIR